MSLRAFAKILAYRTGALSVGHAHRNRNALTVVMFHRVLRPGTEEWRAADPTYAISDTVFAQCLAFFNKHYHPVAIEQVTSAVTGGPALPDHPLLVTFDDGWADNFEIAVPLLRNAAVPAVVFVVPEAIADDTRGRWWHETIFKAHRDGQLPDERIRAMWRQCGAADDSAGASGIELVFALLHRLQRLSPLYRNQILKELESAAESRTRQMMTPDEVRQLPPAGIAVGVHGLTHVPLTLADRPREELADAMRRLESLLGTGYVGAHTMSFPHGRYNASLVEMARDIGYRLQCTSQTHLNPMRKGRPVSDVLGRISVIAGAVTDADDHFRPELLARWLFPRPIIAGA